MGLILTRLLKQNRFSSAGMKFLFQKPTHSNVIQVWTLTRPIQNFKFFFFHPNEVGCASRIIFSPCDPFAAQRKSGFLFRGRFMAHPIITRHPKLHKITPELPVTLLPVYLTSHIPLVFPSILVLCCSGFIMQCVVVCARVSYLHLLLGD